MEDLKYIEDIKKEVALETLRKMEIEERVLSDVFRASAIYLFISFIFCKDSADTLTGILGLVIMLFIIYASKRWSRKKFEKEYINNKKNGKI